MKEKTVIILHRIYNVLESILIVVSGICLIVSCISIYSTGKHPFSREAVAESFSRIAVPVYLCLIMTIVGFILELVLPRREIKISNSKNYSMALNRMHKIKDLSQCDETILKAVLSQQKKRRIHTTIRTVVISVTCIIFLAYALNGNNFQGSINSSMIRAMYVLVPCMLIAFCYALFTACYNEKSMRAEFELMKQAPAAVKSEKAEKNNDGTRINNVIRIVILVIALFILIYGFISGGAADVLTKAANICTECIGLG